MSLNQKILNKALKLQQYHKEGLKEATLMVSLLTGGVSTPPKTQQRVSNAVRAITRRNAQIVK